MVRTVRTVIDKFQSCFERKGAYRITDTPSDEEFIDPRLGRLSGLVSTKFALLVLQEELIFCLSPASAISQR